jgi:cupin fold WbuC family metalloprotein
MQRRELSSEVHVAEGSVVVVRSADLAFLRDRARDSCQRRARLCVHPDSHDRLHEMFIVLDRDSYVRPHRHGRKSESFHVVEGEIDVFLFADDGSVRSVVHLGDPLSGKPFYYRLQDNTFHTPVVVGSSALFHETTNGPFDRTDTEFAPWAPDEADSTAAAYLEHLRCFGRLHGLTQP